MSVRVLIAFLIFFALAFTTTITNIGYKIVNGIESTTKYPSVGALLHKKNNSVTTYCSGTLIGCNSFLTAAHCVEDMIREPNLDNWQVFFPNSGIYEISAAHIHPDYKSSSFPENDIAVLSLKQSVTGIRPIQIHRDTNVANGTVGVISGFGRSGDRNFEYGIKRYGHVTVEKCEDEDVEDFLLCWNFSDPIGQKGQDSNTCNGDSGGPLFFGNGQDMQVAGVTSGGRNWQCMTPDHSYDSKVSYYKSFIEQSAGGDLGNTNCGTLPFAGDAKTKLLGFQVSPQDNIKSTFNIEVNENAKALHVTTNGTDNIHLQLSVVSSDTSQVLCLSSSDQQVFQSCKVNKPAAGKYILEVFPQNIGEADPRTGMPIEGTIQSTATIFY